MRVRCLGTYGSASGMRLSDIKDLVPRTHAILVVEGKASIAFSNRS